MLNRAGMIASTYRRPSKATPTTHPHAHGERQTSPSPNKIHGHRLFSIMRAWSCQPTGGHKEECFCTQMERPTSCSPVEIKYIHEVHSGEHAPANLSAVERNECRGPPAQATLHTARRHIASDFISQGKNVFHIYISCYHCMTTKIQRMAVFATRTYCILRIRYASQCPLGTTAESQ